MISFFPPRQRLLAAFSGLLLAAACPPYELFPLAWVGLIPLFITLERSPGGGFVEGFIAGVVFNTGVIYWLAFNMGTHLIVAAITLVLAVVVLATGWGAAAWVFLKIRSRLGFGAWLLVPFSWVACEGWLTHMGELAFPWPLLALTQSGFNPLLQIMEFTGAAGVTFWVAAVNVLLFMLITAPAERVKRWSVAGLAALTVVAVLAGLHARRYLDSGRESLKISVVQGNIGAHEKWIKGTQFSWSIYDSLSRCAAGADADVDLFIWPETALPAHLMHQSVYADKFARLSSRLNAWILTGASDFQRVGDEQRPLNAAFLAGPDLGITDRYAKIFLVPFGERVPFQWIVPQLGKLNLGQAEFLKGLRPTIFTIPKDDITIRFPVMICYESIFSWISRSAVRRGANLLITISNDAWYGRSPEAEQIAALSRFRCIETRRSMARASNTGISLLIDHLGREIVRTRQFEKSFATAEVPICEATTFYTVHGDLFAAVATLVYGVFLLVAAIGGIRK